jgi:hypothetical protein
VQEENPPERRSIDVAPLVERRKPEDTPLILLLQLVHDDVKHVKTHVAGLDTKLTNHMTDETLTLAEEIATLMNKAFPEGDPLGHRKHHEAVIKAAEARAAFWEKMLNEVTSKGLLGILGLAALWIWTGILKGPMK